MLVLLFLSGCKQQKKLVFAGPGSAATFIDSVFVYDFLGYDQSTFKSFNFVNNYDSRLALLGQSNKAIVNVDGKIYDRHVYISSKHPPLFITLAEINSTFRL